ncbi:MAG TPA: ribonuclease P protein component [Anaerolineales bacterium]|nr:ribonuclease P protein component [Anaerolineales bacterium]HRQ92104.1 ribonuclease P protein component [Anaerolineales bacterium]
MKRGFRLSRPADFKRVRRLGKSYPHPFVVLVVLANDINKVRVGVAAGRSVGGAVQRNRAKRLLRAAAQPLLERIAPGHDLVLIARAAILASGSPEVQNSLERQLRRAKLI